MDKIAIDSLIIPIYEPTKILYIRNKQETGIDMHFVSYGLLIQSETVTNAEAVIGKTSYHASKDMIPNAKLVKIKRQGQATLPANLCRSRLIKIISLKIL